MAYTNHQKTKYNKHQDSVSTETESFFNFKPTKVNKYKNYPSTDQEISKKSISAANPHQREYIKSIKHNVLTIASGSSGTGKTLLALYTGVWMINSQTNQYNIKKILYVRSNVGLSEEKEIGFLPGGLDSKMMLLSMPILDNLREFLPENKVQDLFRNKQIEISTLAMIRGRSLSNTLIILDEAQNASPNSIKTLLTRISYNSKIIITGDTSQTDIEFDPNKYKHNGLVDCINRFKDLEDVGIVSFSKEDIIRHPIIPHILERYET